MIEDIPNLISSRSSIHTYPENPTTKSVYNPVETAFVCAPYLTRPKPTSASRRSKLRVVGGVLLGISNSHVEGSRSKAQAEPGISPSRMVDHAGVVHGIPNLTCPAQHRGESSCGEIAEDAEGGSLKPTHSIFVRRKDMDWTKGSCLMTIFL